MLTFWRPLLFLDAPAWFDELIFNFDVIKVVNFEIIEFGIYKLEVSAFIIYWDFVTTFVICHD